MATRVSRRSLVKGALGTAAAAAAAPLAFGQEPPKPADSPGLDRRLEEVEAKLANPLTPEVRKLTRDALKNLEKEEQDRLKFKLPENSEPCVVFVPTGHAKGL